MASAEAYLQAKFHLDPSNRLATVHQRDRQDRQTDRQRTDSIGQTVLQTVAPKHKLLRIPRHRALLSMTYRAGAACKYRYSITLLFVSCWIGHKFHGRKCPGQKPYGQKPPPNKNLYLQRGIEGFCIKERACLMRVYVRHFVTLCHNMYQLIGSYLVLRHSDHK